jgi:proton glutamate symport protein
MKMHWQIFIALGLALLAGAFTPADSPLVAVYAFGGQLFLNALLMVALPLVMVSMISGMINIGDARSLGRLGLSAFVYFMGTGLLAILTGLFIINLVAPGIIDGAPAGSRLGLSADTETVMAQIGERKVTELSDFFLRMIPTNVFAAAAGGDLLGIIFFSLLFGFFITRLAPDLRQAQQRFWQGAHDVMVGVTRLVMLFAPYGVFALVAKVVSQTGWESVRPLGIFFLCVLGALVFHALVTLSLLLRMAGLSPLTHLRRMGTPLLTAFSTSSSSATLPVTLNAVETQAGVSKRVSGFVIPLGATLNMNGTALYECAAALFIAQAYGLELGYVQQFAVVTIALLSSVGVAGVPSASLVAIAIILGAVGLPLEGVGLILAVDRVLDMCRTAVNVYGDTCAAVIIQRLEGRSIEQDGQDSAG